MVVVVTGCEKASGGFHHIIEEGAYAYAYTYAREHDFSNEQMYGFKRVSSGVCKRKGHELAAAAAGGIPQEGGKLKLVTPGRRWEWMSFGEEEGV